MSVLRIRDVRLLVGAVGLSALGDLLLWIPLALHVEERTGSALAVSAFFLSLWGPVVVLAGVAGLVVDRFENRRLLIAVSLAQAATVAALAFCDSLAGILALSALLGAGVAVSQPAEFALIPAAAGEERVAEANGHVEAARYLGMTAGPLLGGALASMGMLEVALLIDAASFAAVAVAAGALRARRDPLEATSDAGRARDGVVFLARDRTLAVTLAAAIGALAFFSISVTAELFFVVDVLRAGEAAYGVLLAAWTLGMVGGAVVLARRVPAGTLATAALAAVAVQGAGIAAGAAASVLWVAMAGFALGGVAHGLKNVMLRSLIHERVPDALRGRAFAAYNAARNGAELGALAAAGILVAAIGARAALALSGLAPIAIALTALALVHGRRRSADDATTGRTIHAYARR
jgi:MFS family permease